MEPITEASPRVFRPKFMGRMVGVGYLVLAVSGFDLFYVLPRLLVRANAAATAANIKAHEGLFLAGFAAALIGVASYLVVTVLLYRLYEPVNRTLSFCAALFSPVAQSPKSAEVHYSLGARTAPRCRRTPHRWPTERTYAAAGP